MKEEIGMDRAAARDGRGGGGAGAWREWEIPRAYSEPAYGHHYYLQGDHNEADHEQGLQDQFDQYQGDRYQDDQYQGYQHQGYQYQGHQHQGREHQGSQYHYQGYPHQAIQNPVYQDQGIRYQAVYVQSDQNQPDPYHPNLYHADSYHPAPYQPNPHQPYSYQTDPYYSSPYHANMAYPYGNTQYNNYAPAYPNQYAQQPQQPYGQTPPTIRNPFPAPPPAHNPYGAHNANYDPEEEAQLAQWQAQYAPVDPNATKESRGKSDNANASQIGPRAGPADPQVDNGGKKLTVVRKGGGQTWEDPTLVEWDPTQFRIMVGNLAGEVTDDSLTKAFAQYGVSKARVIREKRTTKSKGFGFVAFYDGEQGFKAAREMVGKYIGSHPVTIQRSKVDLKPTVHKDNYKGKGKYNNNNNRGRSNNDKKEKKQDDPLRANTGAVIEKKPVKKAGGYKVIG